LAEPQHGQKEEKNGAGGPLPRTMPNLFQRPLLSIRDTAGYAVATETKNSGQLPVI